VKVIDLLNKIANGEEVPKKVFYKTGGEYTGGYYWNYDESFRDYIDKAGDYVFNKGNYHVIDMLNMEVEIIEEDKKIEKMTPLNNVSGASDLVAISQMQWENNLKIERKINEIIDYLEENK
jgi:hypothetical protein